MNGNAHTVDDPRGVGGPVVAGFRGGIQRGRSRGNLQRVPDDGQRDSVRPQARREHEDVVCGGRPGRRAATDQGYGHGRDPRGRPDPERIYGIYPTSPTIPTQPPSGDVPKGPPDNVLHSSRRTGSVNVNVEPVPT